MGESNAKQWASAEPGQQTQLREARRSSSCVSGLSSEESQGKNQRQRLYVMVMLTTGIRSASVKEMGVGDERIKVVETELSARTQSPSSKDGEVAIQSIETQSTGREQDTYPISEPELLTPESQPASSKSLIGQLCGSQWQVSTDEIGQVRFFGPTSSLHLSEAAMPVISDPCESHGRIQILDDVPLALQQHLFHLYWTFHHSVLPILHKEAFLADMEAGQGRHFSPCLLYWIFVSAARISSWPQVRALAVQHGDGDSNEAQPVILRQATSLLEQEMLNPGLTTVQSLLLCSLFHGSRSKDTRAWLTSGNACRLVFDLGLHKDFLLLRSAGLSQRDLDARQVAFWGCFMLDRLWAVYLGRPHAIKLDDVTMPRPSQDSPSWNMKILSAWVDLLDIQGHVAARLNSTQSCTDDIEIPTEQLHEWKRKLDPSLRYTVEAPSSVYCLQYVSMISEHPRVPIQYHSVMIILHRPHAGFAVAEGTATASQKQSREICVSHATCIARMLQEYREHHGPGYTMLGSAIYGVTTAATTLIADSAEEEQQRGPTFARQLLYLRTCLRTLKEMEYTEKSMKQIRKRLVSVITSCNLDAVPPEDGMLEDAVDSYITSTTLLNNVDFPALDHDWNGLALSNVASASTSANPCGAAQSGPPVDFDMDEFLKMTTQTNLPFSFESLFTDQDGR
ncbi:hypothetical protein AYO20_07701 [Fonsecaea nubica]|uniref:Xylanolytic transcriptional activator regulatory domain-containing protein n=1 Tax=Fonsecaea nubica TaxID=856822 RepID=A0A178CSS8_9EURO|nr:hypothetical protein AYO20_07701 [Fonsecaea nubica]OAL32910.1 hypothetical protein AYO20_07701 [Fonsecaea nubica]